MRRRVRKLLRRAAPALDLCLTPLTLAGGAWLWLAKWIGMSRLPTTRRLLDRLGVHPIRRHFYEPWPAEQTAVTPAPRTLPGLRLDTPRQLRFLAGLEGFADEILAMPDTPRRREFHFGNDAYDLGDAEVLHAVLRACKPRRVIEVGSGMSTLLAVRSRALNAAETPDGGHLHTVVDPYPRPWLATCGVQVLAHPVETLDPAFFDSLEAGDILFIDSSHVTRAGGDVCFLYLHVLPRLRPGVFIHAHDVFTPRDYPRAWLVDQRRLWTEQYLLEALLSGGDRFEILAAVNHLRHVAPEALGRVCPRLSARLAVLPATGAHAPNADVLEPGAFWMRVTHEEGERTDADGSRS